MQILSQVSLRLANMHAAGHVHRSIKPTSIVLLPRAKRWVLSSFTSAARIGSRAPLRAALAYSAPEVVRAYDRGDREVLCLPELDSWSLGVLAFELFTGGPAFRMTSAGREQVCLVINDVVDTVVPCPDEYHKMLFTWLVWIVHICALSDTCSTIYQAHC